MYRDVSIANGLGISAGIARSRVRKTAVDDAAQKDISLKHAQRKTRRDAIRAAKKGTKITP